MSRTCAGSVSATRTARPSRMTGTAAAFRAAKVGAQSSVRTARALLRQEISDSSGQRFEYSRILFRGDKIRLEFHYEL